MDQEEEDELVATLPIHYSENLHPNLHLHQFQLVNRPLVAPPAALQAGKYIKARYKPKTRRYEIHVPNDVRAEVWNPTRGQDFGKGRYNEDKEEAVMHDVKFQERDDNEKRVNETRLQSEKVPQIGEYVLGVVRNGRLTCDRSYCIY